MSGACHRRKGDRLEREIVDRHREIGVHAERYPLSGASRFRGSGHDVDLYPFGREQAPLVTEVKGRKDGAVLHHAREVARRIRRLVSPPE
jgi:Holliday junction resolvase